MKKILYALPFLLMSQVSLGQHSEMWGTTLAGGQYEAGFVFKMNPDGSDYEIVYAFNGTSTGRTGYNQLTQGNDGLLYGVTGGTSGAGTIFTVDPVSGAHTVVHYFNPFNYVRSKLTLATNGKFYGIGSGFMFEFDPSNKSVRIIDPWDSFSFLFGEGFLLEIEPNVLYGAAPGFGGAGAIFKYDISTDTYTTLHFFNGEDGDSPNSDLLLSPDSLLYGTTISEGDNNRGTLFSYDLKKDTLVVEAHLDSEHNLANGGLVQHENGLIFGATTIGGSSSSGSIFEFNPTTKALRTVYNAPPTAGILLTPMLGFNGNIYVMSRNGGSGAGFGRIVAYDPSS
ncbi:MAG: choice-of-anchor tandem repeat GloVer-containing protein [Bacteroidota bacterium]